MLLSKLLKKIEYEHIFADFEVDHITNDSRKAHASSVFVCIKGFLNDGHSFALSAYKNGCRAFVCEYTPKDLPNDATVILVPNTRRALALLACELYGNPSEELYVIGITGTKGKTTSALMIKQLLDSAGIPTGYIGSNGIFFGEQRIEAVNTTPESHLIQYYMRMMLDAGMRALVMEVSSQALALGRTLGIKFDTTLFTNLSPDHIGPGEHESFEEYFNAKKRLFDEYESKLVIANADDEYTDRILADCKAKKIYYSIDKPSQYRASDIELYRDREILGINFTVNTENGESPCSLAIPGEFNVHNALSCLALAEHMGIPLDFSTNTLSIMKIDGRFETVLTPDGACFVIDYAHNGLSLRSVLTSLRRYEPSRLICLYGSVGCRTQVRRVQLGKVASLYADYSILTSDNPSTEDPQAIIDEIATQYPNPESYVSIPDREKAIRLQ